MRGNKENCNLEGVLRPRPLKTMGESYREWAAAGVSFKILNDNSIVLKY